MVRIPYLALIGLSMLMVGVLSAPTNTSNATLPSVEDIFNAPYNPAPIVNPAFIPIVAGDNSTIINNIPVIQSQVDSVPSVLSSITSAAATATDTVLSSPTSTITTPSKVKRGGGPPTLPPTPNYDNTECAFANTVLDPTNPLSQKLWNAAALVACHNWFGVPGDPPPFNSPSSSPAVYLIEDSYQSQQILGNIQGFEFEYWVRDDPSPFTQWYFNSQEKCHSELLARIQWMFSNCGPFGDISGFSSYDDPDSVIVYKAWKLPGPPLGFSPSPNSP